MCAQQIYDDESMPKSQATTTGMKIIKGDYSNILARQEIEDIIYTKKNNKDLRIRMVYPQSNQAVTKWPMVVHVQGSAWFQQNLSEHLLDFKKIVTSGFILAVVEYLPLPEAIFPSKIEDLKTAVHFLSKNSQKYHIDLNNIFLSGDSSGGHTALMSWATWNQPFFEQSSEKLPPIRGCINHYGVVDLRTTPNGASTFDHASINSVEAQFLGGKRPLDFPELAEQSAVVSYINQEWEYAPLLILHGNKDRVVPFEQSIQLFEACKKHDLEAQFYCVDEADHGGPLFYSEAVIDTIIDFLKCHIIE